MDQFEKSFLEKLGQLNGTQVSIQNLTVWLIQNKSIIKHVGKIWYKELKKVHRKRKLIFLYLMNDVVQTSRKQGPEFQRVFASVLTHAMKDCAKAADSKVLASVDRLVRIWHERRVFEPELLQRCRQMLEKFTPKGGASSAARTGAASSATAGHDGGVGRTSVSTGVATTEIGVDPDEPRSDDDEDDDLSDGDERGGGGLGVSDSDSDGCGVGGGGSGPAMCDTGVGSDDESPRGSSAAAANFILSRQRNVGNGGGGAQGGIPGVAAAGTIGGVGVGALRAELAAQMELERIAADLPDSDRILSELQFLAAAPSGSAEMRRRISRFPKHIVEEASVDQCRTKRDCQRLLREVVPADDVCSEYNRQLSGEVDRRRAFHSDLRAYCRGQRAALDMGRTQLEAQRRRLRELRALRVELGGHLANLPDLATLPAVSGGGLAPLPSVGDLFS